MDIVQGEGRGRRKKTTKRTNTTTTTTRKIPAFGDWDMAIANDLPITQYFESALQAGLVRYSSSSSTLSAADCPPPPLHPLGQKKNREKSGGINVKEGGINRSNKQGAGKVFDVTATELPPLSATKRRPNSVNAVKKHSQYDVGLGAPRNNQQRRAPKAVDEDLYKIPPELIKRKRRLGFISRCLVPPCAV